MLERAAVCTDNPNAGLHIGECIKPGNYGVLGYAVMSCKTASEAFERHMRYENLVSDRATSTYVIESDIVRLIWDTKGEKVSALMEDENVASWATFARWISAQPMVANQVKFTHSAPDDMSEYTRIFECEVLFDQPRVEIVFDKQYLHTPIIQHDPVMKGMMDAYAERLLAAFNQSDEFLTTIHSYLIKALPEGHTSLEKMAEHLELTPRTLQRRLSEQQETFQSVLDKTRKELALSYIKQPFINLSELAYLLGFSDQTAFQRAFKKWTGSTPGKYRK